MAYPLAVDTRRVVEGDDLLPADCGVLAAVLARRGELNPDRAEDFDPLLGDDADELPKNGCFRLVVGLDGLLPLLLPRIPARAPFAAGDVADLDLRNGCPLPVFSAAYWEDAALVRRVDAAAAEEPKEEEEPASDPFGCFPV